MPGKQKKILIVDDSSAIRRTLRYIFNSWGYDVVVADDGIQGLTKFAETAFDLALIDFCMPGMDGMELAKCLKDSDMDMPVVMISGQDEETLEPCIKSPFIDSVVFKPFTLGELRLALEIFLGEHFWM